MAKSVFSALALLTLATGAFAGCETHTFGTCEDNIVHWYDPNTGEICDPLDCGGGRAPVKYNVPGCAAYTGTLTRPTEPSYMPCFTSSSSLVLASPTPATTTSSLAIPTATTGASSSLAPSASSASSESQAGPTTSGASSTVASSSIVTGLPTISRPPAGSSASAGNGTTTSKSSTTTASSSTTVPPSAGNIVGSSWAAVVAGVALGALAVL